MIYGHCPALILHFNINALCSHHLNRSLLSHSTKTEYGTTTTIVTNNTKNIIYWIFRSVPFINSKNDCNCFLSAISKKTKANKNINTKPIKCCKNIVRRFFILAQLFGNFNTYLFEVFSINFVPF